MLPLPEYCTQLKNDLHPQLRFLQTLSSISAENNDVVGLTLPQKFHPDLVLDQKDFSIERVAQPKSGGFVLRSNLLPFSAENIFLDASGIMHPRQPMDGDD